MWGVTGVQIKQRVLAQGRRGKEGRAANQNTVGWGLEGWEGMSLVGLHGEERLFKLTGLRGHRL